MSLEPLVSSRFLLACRDTLAAGLKTTWSGMCPVRLAAVGARPPVRNLSELMSLRDPHPSDMPDDVGMSAWEASPRMVVELHAANLPELHALALAQAWAEGAWDLQVCLHPPLQGPELGLVDADTEWTGCDPRLAPLLRSAAETGRLATWSWRPMAGGPAMRRKRWAKTDATLDAGDGRAGPPPALKEPDWRWRESRIWLLQLGRWTEEARPAPRPVRAARRATGAQRAYIVALRRRTGREVGAPLPTELTVGEASAIIDRLSAPEGRPE